MEIYKRINSLTSANDLYDILSMVNAIDDDEAKEAYLKSITLAVLKKIGSEHPQSTGMAKILLTRLEN